MSVSHVQKLVTFLQCLEWAFQGPMLLPLELRLPDDQILYRIYCEKVRATSSHSAYLITILSAVLAPF